MYGRISLDHREKGELIIEIFPSWRLDICASMHIRHARCFSLQTYPITTGVRIAPPEIRLSVHPCTSSAAARDHSLESRKEPPPGGKIGSALPAGRGCLLSASAHLASIKQIAGLYRHMPSELLCPIWPITRPDDAAHGFQLFRDPCRSPKRFKLL